MNSCLEAGTLGGHELLPKKKLDHEIKSELEKIPSSIKQGLCTAICASSSSD
ncbi:hypothetical protein COCSUDRAFT_32271 [Coccomyxa subellipsoidea C-169]|uniref:Uncharacterized protein n=1 Tax=Coccomyxa subellipsoidea (strain C-169) TaxID=574566 RepID=I0Z809_COCSC|nr:hypothetical protein COCSUDRAFT_32271 [Coccomyxa subellipsoidea C-169]EIE26778.1 hypothetical protein COCSUDRAFT_32271 [Coccomyxa subellipsoidea C-169]|eukprot:XP_005651322.1 hypothetical protein COCSUDRAFT_32271 [Coccomyxa subellipsoidea C-169]